jgi:sirohydrochlorin cobaltochelatase
MTEKTKPVIVLIADGAAGPEGQKTLNDLDKLICGKYPDYEVRWGIQASYMIAALQKRGVTTFLERNVPLLGADDLLSKLAEEGKKELAMQCLMMHESSFSRNALEVDTRGMTVKYGLPFLSSDENIEAMVETCAPSFGDGIETATVMIGHGVFKDFEFNDCFVKISDILRKNHRNAFLGTLHGPPGTEQMVADVKQSGCKKVRFISLMIATSEHVSKDVMGDEAESWKSQIGLPAEVVDNVGENPVLLDYFVNNIKTLLTELG